MTGIYYISGRADIIADRRDLSPAAAMNIAREEWENIRFGRDNQRSYDETLMVLKDYFWESFHYWKPLADNEMSAYREALKDIRELNKDPYNERYVLNHSAKEAFIAEKMKHLRFIRSVYRHSGN